jgi:leucyl aminopeptidase (aminopeptidase T)
MAELEGMDDAVRAVVRDCLGIGEGENALIVVDEATRAIGEALRTEAAAAGADAVLALMDERATDGTEPPPPIAAALAAADVYIAPTSRSISHTRARKAASDAGVRGATMPGVTAEMLARVMSDDMAELSARSRAVAELMDGASTARISCPRGSDLVLELEGRRAIADDGRLREPGVFGNLPCGEGFIAPLGGSGRAFASSLATIGIVDDPVELTLEGGRLVAAAGEAGERFMAALTAHGELGTNLAELGVGTNARALLTGNILEDEKILGTVHIAFGASAAIGGTVSVPIHLDVVILEATLAIDSTPVLERGRFVLPT